MKYNSRFPLFLGLVVIFFITSLGKTYAQQEQQQNSSTQLPYSDFYHVRDGLSHFYSKIKRHQPVTVAFLGGSITYNPGWRNMICNYFQKSFPQEKFHFIQAGIPSLGSLPDAFRLQRDVLDSGRIDLLFVEAAVNDWYNGTDSITQIRDLEGIVRHAKKSNPDMDILLMSFAGPGKLKDYGEGKIPVAVRNHELVAQHYRLPSLNLALEVYKKIQAGEFSWEKDFKSIHPAPFGENLYFMSIQSLLNACFTKWNSSGSAAPKYHLPGKMNKYSFDDGEYYPIQKAKLSKDWKLVPDWSPKDHAETREGFVHIPVLESEVPGATLTLPFKGTAIGFSVLAGPDAGTVSYSIDGQPFQNMNLFTQWSGNLYLPWYELFSGTLKNKNHVLILKIAHEKDAESKGYACRIVYFLVNKK